MPTKNFEGKTAAIDKFINRADEPETSETSKPSQISKISKTSKISKISQTSKKPGPPPMLDGYYPFCLRLSYDDHEYLKQASWELHQDVTAYLRDLIKADREANAKKSRRKP